MNEIITTIEAHQGTFSVAGAWLVREMPAVWQWLLQVYPYLKVNGGLLGIIRSFFVGDAVAKTPEAAAVPLPNPAPIIKVGIVLLILSLACAMGCKTTPQAVAYNTLTTLEQTTTASFDGYIQLVIAKQLPTNDVPKVSAAYNAFQASMELAAGLVNNDTNAVAPASLVVDSQNILNLITTIEGTK